MFLKKRACCESRKCSPIDIKPRTKKIADDLVAAGISYVNNDKKGANKKVITFVGIIFFPDNFGLNQGRDTA